jgi:hypothetical protein
MQQASVPAQHVLQVRTKHLQAPLVAAYVKVANFKAVARVCRVHPAPQDRTAPWALHLPQSVKRGNSPGQVCAIQKYADIQIPRIL